MTARRFATLPVATLPVVICLAVALGFSGAARAQAGFAGVPLTPPPGVSEPVPPTSPDDLINVNAPNGSGGYDIRLGAFASAQDLDGAITSVDATAVQLGALSQQVGASVTQLNALSAQFNTLSAQMTALAADITRSFDSLQSRADQGAALAGAFTVLQPEPGSRFAITVSGADFAGEGAGSVTASYRVAARLVVFGGYARSASYNMFKAGLSLSFN